MVLRRTNIDCDISLFTACQTQLDYSISKLVLLQAIIYLMIQKKNNNDNNNM